VASASAVFDAVIHEHRIDTVLTRAEASIVMHRSVFMPVP